MSDKSETISMMIVGIFCIIMASIVGFVYGLSWR
jgi:ABC-type amino acid transport system permease subunit